MKYMPLFLAFPALLFVFLFDENPSLKSPTPGSSLFAQTASGLNTSEKNRADNGDPKERNYYWNRAYHHLKNKDCRKALPFLEKADQRGEEVHWIYNNLVNCLLKEGNEEEALRYARKGMIRFPEERISRTTLIWALNSAGWKAFKERNYDRSEKLFRESLDLDDSNAGTLNGYGVALRESPSPLKLRNSVDALTRAFKLSPETSYILGNLRHSYYKLLDQYSCSHDFGSIERIVYEIYDHYDSNKKHYKKNNIHLNDIEDQVAAPYSVCGLLPDKKVGMQDCIQSLERVLKAHSENYRLKQILGNAYTNSGDNDKGYRFREEAYEDYVQSRKPVDPGIVLQSPLRGRVFTIKYNPPKPKSHSGLWRHAVDYITVDESGKNTSYGSPVYAPADGEITHVGDGSEEHSNIWLRMDNGYTVGLVHFKPGSFTVSKGHRVKAGGKLGVLGIPSNAHLHMHIFNEHGATVPYSFHEFREKSGKTLRNRAPEPGEYYYYP